MWNYSKFPIYASLLWKPAAHVHKSHGYVFAYTFTPEWWYTIIGTQTIYYPCNLYSYIHHDGLGVLLIGVMVNVKPYSMSQDIHFLCELKPITCIFLTLSTLCNGSLPGLALTAFTRIFVVLYYQACCGIFKVPCCCSVLLYATVM